MSTVEVSRTIAAGPDQLYAMVSDLPRMKEWSPENQGGAWIKGTTGPVVGAKFKGRNRLGSKKWSTVATVVVADPGREFAFDVVVGPFGVARWGYRFRAVEGGTEVTEYWVDHRAPLMAKITSRALGIDDRAEHNRVGMTETLERLAAVVS